MASPAPQPHSSQILRGARSVLVGRAAGGGSVEQAPDDPWKGAGASLMGIIRDQSCGGGGWLGRSWSPARSEREHGGRRGGRVTVADSSCGGRGTPPGGVDTKGKEREQKRSKLGSQGDQISFGRTEMGCGTSKRRWLVFGRMRHTAAGGGVGSGDVDDYTIWEEAKAVIWMAVKISGLGVT